MECLKWAIDTGAKKSLLIAYKYDKYLGRTKSNSFFVFFQFQDKICWNVYTYSESVFNFLFKYHSIKLFSWFIYFL
jgi:hypothetical protein